MVRDLFGNRVKEHTTLFEQGYMEKFYIFHGEIFQVVRMKRVFKVGRGFFYTIWYRKPNWPQNKMKSYEIDHEEFTNRKFLHTYAKALSALKREAGK